MQNTIGCYLKCYITGQKMAPPLVELYNNYVLFFQLTMDVHDVL